MNSIYKKIIIISASHDIIGEAALVNQLFEVGLPIFHIRKYGWTQLQVIDFLNQIDQQYHSRIVLCHHYELVLQYHLKGIHLSERDRLVIDSYHLADFRNVNKTISSSFHDLKTIIDCPIKLDYAFISPVFDSISKQGYKGQVFDLKDYMGAIDLIALGGIHAENVTTAFEIGFTGVGLLGCIWEDESTSVENLQKILKLC